jgi:hypothetical protein
MCKRSLALPREEPRENQVRPPIRDFSDDYYWHQWMRWARELGEFQHDPRFTMDEAFGGTVADPFSTGEERKVQEGLGAEEMPEAR